MRIVVITAENHHTQYLVYKMKEKYDVVGVFHFKRLVDFERSLIDRARSFFKDAGRFGFFPTFSSRLAHHISRTATAGFGYEQADEHFRLLLEGRHDATDAVFCDDINSPEAVEKIRSLSPDLIVCHGGPRYRKEIVSAAKLVINYHSGVSPYFNGAHTHAHTIVRNNPLYHGGTLMVLNENIDGGAILGHFLAKTDIADTPADLFIRLMYGSFEIVDAFISHYGAKGTFHSHPQSADGLYYFRHWRMAQILKLIFRRLNRSARAGERRTNFIARYWEEEPDPERPVWSRLFRPVRTNDHSLN